MGQCFVDDIEGKNYVFVDFNILALGYLFKYITYGMSLWYSQPALNFLIGIYNYCLPSELPSRALNGLQFKFRARRQAVVR